jgi:hypothetical protein
MTTIMPDGEEIRKAVKWLSAERQQNPEKSVNKLAEEASLKFDLSPSESEYLLRFLKEGTSD